MVPKLKFFTNEYYHLFNRGVAKQRIFHDFQDFQHFLTTLGFYLEAKPKNRLSHTSQKDRSLVLKTKVDKPLIEILCYCLMPNHFHLLVQQLRDGGVTTFMRRALNSYTRVYNTRYNRIGTAFQGRFQAVRLDDDNQLLHVSRYIHLNPVVANIIDNSESYNWSSYSAFLQNRSSRLCSPKLIMDIIGSSQEYKDFCEDHIDYARDLAIIKDTILEK